MEIQLMDIQRQHSAHASEYENAALDVLRSGTYIGGPEVAAFEQEFADFYGAKYGISCGNGTDALVLALRALGIGKGDEVITVSWTFFATAESIAAVGATPVFIDVDKDTYCMKPDLIEDRITSRTKAVLPVHFYGQSCDMDAIRGLCRKHGLFLVVDCAQAAGTKYRGEYKGILGDVSCFSFFPTKNLGCDGDGGMVLTDDEEVKEACQALKVHGSGKNGLEVLKRDYVKRGKSLPVDMPLGESKYYNYLIGYNTRLDAVQAAILRKKLEHLEDFIKGRRANARFYYEHLSGTSYITPKEAPYSYCSYYLYVLKHHDAKNVMAQLKSKGIGCGVYYPVPLHLQGAFVSLGYREGDLPVTEDLARTTFAIPVFPELTKQELEYVVAVLRGIEYER